MRTKLENDTGITVWRYLKNEFHGRDFENMYLLAKRFGSEREVEAAVEGWKAQQIREKTGYRENPKLSKAVLDCMTKIHGYREKLGDFAAALPIFNRVRVFADWALKDYCLPDWYLDAMYAEPQSFDSFAAETLADINYHTERAVLTVLKYGNESEIAKAWEMKRLHQEVDLCMTPENNRTRIELMDKYDGQLETATLKTLPAGTGTNIVRIWSDIARSPDDLSAGE